MDKNIEHDDTLKCIEGKYFNVDNAFPVTDEKLKEIIDNRKLSRNDYIGVWSHINYKQDSKYEKLTPELESVKAVHYYHNFDRLLTVSVSVKFKDHTAFETQFKVDEMVDLNNLLLRFESYDYYVEYIADFVLDIDMLLLHIPTIEHDSMVDNHSEETLNIEISDEGKERIKKHINENKLNERKTL